MTDFEIMAAIAKRNGKIGSCNLNSNLISIEKCKQGYRVTIGVDDRWGREIMQDSVVGALYVVDRREFANEQARAALAKEAQP